MGVMNHAHPYLLGLLIGVLALLYVYSAAVASWHLRNTTYFTRGQKLAQLAIVWLLPIIGVAFVLSMLGPDVARAGFRYLNHSSWLCSFIPLPVPLMRFRTTVGQQIQHTLTMEEEMVVQTEMPPNNPVQRTVKKLRFLPSADLPR